MSTLSECLGRLDNKNGVFLLDGGTGEELFRRGVPDDRKLWSATAIVHSEYHSILEEVHQSFLHAGAQAITTNSYGIVPGVGFDNAKERQKYMDMAGAIARRAATASGKKDTFVLGSLGPLVESYRADLIRSHIQGVQEYRMACQALRPHVDAFLAETMSCVEESLQALEAVIMETDCEVPALVSFTLDSQGHLRDGQVVTDGLKRLMDYAKQTKVHLLGILFNCSEPEAITLALAQIKSDNDLANRLHDTGIRLGAYANRLTALHPEWTLADSTAPQPLRQDLDEPHYWNDLSKSGYPSTMSKLLVGVVVSLRNTLPIYTLDWKKCNKANWAKHNDDWKLWPCPAHNHQRENNANIIFSMISPLGFDSSSSLDYSSELFLFDYLLLHFMSAKRKFITTHWTSM